MAAFGRRQPCIFVALWLLLFVPSSRRVRSRGSSDGRRREGWRTAAVAAAAQQREDGEEGLRGQVAAVHVCPLNRCCSNDLGRCEDGRTLTLAEQSVAVGFFYFFFLFFSSSMTTCAAFLRSSFFAVLSLFLSLVLHVVVFSFCFAFKCVPIHKYEQASRLKKKKKVKD